MLPPKLITNPSLLSANAGNIVLNPLNPIYLIIKNAGYFQLLMENFCAPASDIGMVAALPSARHVMPRHFDWLNTVFADPSFFRASKSTEKTKYFFNCHVCVSAQGSEIVRVAEFLRESQTHAALLFQEFSIVLTSWFS